MYEAIIRLRLTHGTLVWWQICTLKTHQNSLDKVQRLVIGGITGSPSITPLAVLKLILGIPLLQAFIKGEASKTWWRIRDVMRWHVGIRGNEKADRLAGRDARQVRATRCSIGIPPGDIKKKTSLLMKEEILRKWRESPGLRQAKRITSVTPPEQWLQDVGRLNRPRLRRVVGWLTAHWWVRHYLKCTILDEGNCRWCGRPEESTFHLLC